ncbi:MAG: sodium:solute symporter family protein [Acidobacteriota bacterium]
MIDTVAIIVLALYGAVLALIGVWAGRRVRVAADFYVAGHRLGPLMLAATVLAANIGSGTTVGVAGLGYTIGAGAVWWTGSAVVGTFVLALTLGPRMWRVARDLGCYTVGDYLEHRFGVALRATVMALLWIGSVLVLMAQIIAIGTVLQAFSGLALPYGIVVGGAVVLVYYAAGGLWSSAVVNMVQLGVKLVAFPSALLATAWALGGVAALRAAAPSISADFLSPTNVGLLSAVGYLGVLGTSFVISPGILQKAFGARDEGTARRGLLLAGTGLAAFAFIPVALGMFARLHWPMTLDPGDPLNQWVLPRLMVDVLPPALGILTLAAVVSAELSSADAVLFMLSTSMSRDFYQRFWRPDVDDAGLLRAGRGAAVVGLVAAVLLALRFPSILGGLGTFYAILVASLTVPLVAGLYWPRCGNRAALAALASSLAVATAAWAYTGRSLGPGNLWPSVAGIGVGAAACVLVTLWSSSNG